MAYRFLFMTTFFFGFFLGSPAPFAASSGTSLKELLSDEEKKSPPKKKRRKPRNSYKKKLAPDESKQQQQGEQKTSSEVIVRISPINSQNKTSPHKDKEETETETESALPSLNQKLSPAQENTKKKKRKRKKRSKATPSPLQTTENQADQAEEGVLEKRSLLRFVKALSEDTLRGVEKTIQHVIQEKRERPVKINVALSQKDIGSFHEAFTTLVKKYPFPFTWSITNKGLSALEEDESSYILELSLSSLAKEREEVETSYVYQVSQEEEEKVNWPHVFDVAMQSKFRLEDFKFNNSIKIRILELQSNTEEKTLDEFCQILKTRLPKDNNPFHILGIQVNKEVGLAQGKMLEGLLRKVSEANVGLRSRGMVCDSQSDSLYICLDNAHRKILDLHGTKHLTTGEYEGRSVKEAGQETQNFIIQAYETFKEDVTVLTGRGNHVNANGTKGALKEAFKNDWMKDSFLSSIIKNHFPLEGEGGYKVVFVKAENLDLNNKNQLESLYLLRQAIAQMAQQKKTRLRVSLGHQAVPLSQNPEFHLMMQVCKDLQIDNPQLLKSVSPISFESTPGEMKIIFNKEHPKSSSSFCFANSYGSPSVFGTIH